MISPTDQTNFCYFPVCFSSHKTRELVYEKLRKHDIYARRYFSPLLCDDDSVLKRLSNAQDLVSRVLCIPIFPDLSEVDALRICRVINQSLKNLTIKEKLLRQAVLATSASGDGHINASRPKL